nr:ribonuclease H-like domain-containing protein [Tanacetum cinerariifolium]
MLISAEVEFRGVANSVAETFWLRNLLRGLHSPLHSATIVYCDNRDIDWTDASMMTVFATMAYAGSESRPPMLNKENYVSCSSHLLRYAKSRPNGKLIHNSIINGPYLRRMIPEPKKIASNLKFLNLQPEWSRHVTIVHQRKDLYTADYTQLYDFLKYNQKEVDELKVERLVKTQDPLALMVTSNNPYNFPMLNQDQPSFNQKYMQQPMPNPEDITDPTTTMNMALALMVKAFKLNYSTPTNNNQRISSNPRNRQITQPGMNMGQDRQMQMVGGNGENQFRQYVGQNVGNLNGYNAVQNVGDQVAQNPRVQNVRNQNGLIGVPGNANQNGNGNLAVARAEGNTAGHNENQISCYNCRGEEAGIQLQAEEFDLMATAADLDEIKEVNANCNLMANLQQASTSGTQTDKTPVYDSDGSAEEATKFVGDFKSLAKEADESLAKQKALELEIERLLRAVVSQDIMSVMQKTFVVDTSNLQTELEPYKDVQKKIEQLQAQLGDLKGKSKDTLCVSTTLNPLSQKLQNENVELEFQVLNYARENAYLKTTYKNLFDSISVSRTQTKTIIASLQKQLHNSIYENAKLRSQLFNKVSDQKDNKRGTSANTKFAKQTIVENFPKVGETHALSNPVTSISVPTPQESKVVKNDKVIALGMFRINPFKTSREEKHVPNNARASARIKPITVSQPLVFTKKDVNSDSNGLSSTGIDNTKTRRPQPRSNTKNDRQCLMSVNHDVCLCNYVNGKKSPGKIQKANVSIKEKQKKHQPKGKKPKKVGFIERLATPKPSKPKFLLRWSPTGRLFDQKGKIVDSSEFESQSNCSNGDNACTSNTLELKINGFQILLLCLAVGKYFDHRVYFVEGLGHNLFSVGQFYDSDLETMNVSFDELLAMAFEQRSSKPGLQSELDLLFEALYDDYIGGQPSATARTVPAAQGPQFCQTSTASTSIADTAQTPTNLSSHATNFPNTSQDVDELNSQQQHVSQQEIHAHLQSEIVADNVPNALFDGNTFVNPFAIPSTSAAESSSSHNVDPSNMHTFYQPYPHEFQWTKDHPLKQVIEEPSRPVLKRNQLQSDGDMCMYALTVSTMELKNVKEAMTDPA